LGTFDENNSISIQHMKFGFIPAKTSRPI